MTNQEKCKDKKNKKKGWKKSQHIVVMKAHYCSVSVDSMEAFSKADILVVTIIELYSIIAAITPSGLFVCVFCV